MLPIIVDQLANLLRTPHVGIALLVSDQEVEVRSGRGVLARLVGQRGSLSEGLVGEIFRAGRVFLTTDASREERIRARKCSADWSASPAFRWSARTSNRGRHRRPAVAVRGGRGPPADRRGRDGRERPEPSRRDGDHRACVAERDIRPRGRRPRRLQELDQLKSAFVSNVSHELPAPITNILLYLDLLAEPKREDRRPTYMGILHSEASRLHRLIEDLLTLSRLERGAAALDLEPQVLDPLIAPVTASHVARAHLKQIDLRHEPNPNVPLVRRPRPDGPGAHECDRKCGGLLRQPGRS